MWREYASLRVWASNGVLLSSKEDNTELLRDVIDLAHVLLVGTVS